MNGEVKDFHDAWQEFLTEAFGFGQSAASKRTAQQGPVNLKNIGVADAEAEGPQFEEEEFPADGLRRILHFVDEIGATDAERQRKILEELEKMLAEQKLTIKEEFVPDTQASSMKHQAALLGDRNRASFIWDETKFPTLSKLLFQLHVREYNNYVTLMELFITAGFSIKSVNAVDNTLNRMQQHAPKAPKPQPAQELSPEETPGADEAQDVQGRGTDEEEHSEPEEETSLTTRLKDVFGAGMDIGGLASFFPGIGQAIGGATTAASLINNLTYDPPKYAWAAVDLAALSVAFLPGGTGVAKGSKIAIKLQKAAFVLPGAQQAGKVAKAGTGALTIQQELKAGLPEDAYNAVVSALTARNKNGTYVVGAYLKRIRAIMANKFGEDSKAVEIVDGFKTQIFDLQRKTEESSEPLNESKTIKRWKTLAGVL